MSLFQRFATHAGRHTEAFLDMQYALRLRRMQRKSVYTPPQKYQVIPDCTLPGSYASVTEVHHPRRREIHPDVLAATIGRPWVYDDLTAAQTLSGPGQGRPAIITGPDSHHRTTPTLRVRLMAAVRRARYWADCLVERYVRQPLERRTQPIRPVRPIVAGGARPATPATVVPWAPTIPPERVAALMKASSADSCVRGLFDDVTDEVLQMCADMEARWARDHAEVAS